LVDYFLFSGQRGYCDICHVHGVLLRSLNIPAPDGAGHAGGALDPKLNAMSCGKASATAGRRYTSRLRLAALRANADFLRERTSSPGAAQRQRREREQRTAANSALNQQQR